MCEILRRTSAEVPEQPEPAHTFLTTRSDGTVGDFWIPLPFHRITARAGLNKILGQLLLEPDMRRMFLSAGGFQRDTGQVIPLRIAWQLTGQSFLADIRSANHRING